MRINTLRRAVQFGLAALAISIVAAASLPRTVTAQYEYRRTCSTKTLRGDYGIAVSGTRAIGPNATESFIGTGRRTYDGEGNFSQIDSIHGQNTQVSHGEANGTYEVYPDCTGLSKIYPTGTAIVIEVAFVIVDDGREVKEAVMRPLPNMVTATVTSIR